MSETKERAEGATPARREASPAVLRRAKLRLAHAGKWVAWTPDDTDIVAVADTRAGIQEKVRSLGIPGLSIELAPPETYR